MSTIQQFNATDLAAAEQLRTLSVRIMEMDDPVELASTAAKAEAVKAYAKAQKLGHDVAVKASKLSIACALRIGKIGYDHLESLPVASHRAHVKNLLNRRSYDELMEKLADMEGPVSLHALVMDVAHEDSAAEIKAKADRVQQGGAPEMSDYYNEQMSRREEQERRVDAISKSIERTEALSVLLENAYQDGDPFKVSDVVDNLLDTVADEADQDMDAAYVREILGASDVRSGVAEVVRHAIRTESADAGHGYEVRGEILRPPRFVTYRDSEAGWVRIPWKRATLGQLMAMAFHRKEQAAQVAESAKALSSIVDSFVEKGKSPEAFLGDLFRGYRIEVTA